MRKGTKTATATGDSGTLLGFEAHATGNGYGGRARSQSNTYGQEPNYTNWRPAGMDPTMSKIVSSGAGKPTPSSLPLGKER